MVKRITRVLLLLQGLLAFAIALALHSQLHFSVPAAILAGLGVILLVRMGITANNFFINRYYCGSAPKDLCLSWSEWLRVYLTEFKSTMYCSSWAMPFLAFHKRDAPHPVGLPVLLVHGYGCNSGYWHGMSKALSEAGITHHAVDLEPVFADIDDYVPHLCAAVDTLRADTGSEKIVIVAHSMGGLAARAYLRAAGDAKVAKVITLGSPHSGTGLANFGLGPNSRQMRWTGTAQQGEASEWLRQLRECESGQRMSRFISLYSHHDNIIAPQASSYLPGAKNISFKGVGHVSLAYAPAVQECVIREILAAASE